MIKVAILMATFNGSAFLRQQLESIFDQEKIEVTLFISDDVSSDDTLTILQEFHLRGLPVHIISKDRKFGSAAPNFFWLIKNVDVSLFDFVALSDQDDIWFSNKIANAIESMRLSGAEAYSSSFVAYWPSLGRKIYVDKISKQTRNDFWFQSPGPGCSQVFTIRSFLLMQSFIKNNWHAVLQVDYHDWFTYAFFRYFKIKWLIANDANFLYVQHSKNQLGVNNGIFALLDRAKMMSGGWYSSQCSRVYAAVTGGDFFKDFCTIQFLLRNIFWLRRKKCESFIVALLFIFHLFYIRLTFRTEG